MPLTQRLSIIYTVQTNTECDIAIVSLFSSEFTDCKINYFPFFCGKNAFNFNLWKIKCKMTADAHNLLYFSCHKLKIRGLFSIKPNEITQNNRYLQCGAILVSFTSVFIDTKLQFELFVICLRTRFISRSLSLSVSQTEGFFFRIRFVSSLFFVQFIYYSRNSIL